mgnify:FL=1
MVSLDSIKSFCLDKKIIIVGNSSRLLGSNYARVIDSYDIVVRINRGYQQGNLYTKMIGSKTTILSVGVKSASAAMEIVGVNPFTYVLSPIIWSDKLQLPNVYNVEVKDYNILKASSNTNKPSTGISTYNFFNKLNNFKRLDLVGFDFFESSNSFRNQLGHLGVTDHTGVKEKEFFEKVKDNSRTQLYDMKTNITPKSNTPTYYQPLAKPHVIKNNKR